jgi:thiamine biosynthesis lipoprotein
LNTLNLYRFRFSAMASPCQLQLYASNRAVAEQAAEAALADIRRIETRYSRYRDDSVTAAINRAAAAGTEIEVDAETAALLDYAAACFADSDGLFDISSGILRDAWDFNSARLPEPDQLQALLHKVGWEKVSWQRPRLAFGIAGMEIDFGGIGKEYAADRAANLCRHYGIAHGLVELGGDIAIIGAHPDGAAWQVGVRRPDCMDDARARFAVLAGGVASSGDYARGMVIDGRRYGHILNPRTGWPVTGLQSVTVVADQCIVAGSASTIAMLKSVDGIAWLQECGLPSIWIDADGELGQACLSTTVPPRVSTSFSSSASSARRRVSSVPRHTTETP